MKLKTFVDKSPLAVKRRIQAEPFCGVYILCVDGRRVGHAVDKKSVRAMKHFLAHSLEDLERLFTGQEGARRKNY